MDMVISIKGCLRWYVVLRQNRLKDKGQSNPFYNARRRAGLARMASVGSCPWGGFVRRHPVSSSHDVTRQIRVNCAIYAWYIPRCSYILCHRPLLHTTPRTSEHI